jgi:hypothetical protein
VAGYSGGGGALLTVLVSAATPGARAILRRGRSSLSSLERFLAMGLSWLDLLRVGSTLAIVLGVAATGSVTGVLASGVFVMPGALAIALIELLVFGRLGSAAGAELVFLLSSGPTAAAASLEAPTVCGGWIPLGGMEMLFWLGAAAILVGIARGGTTGEATNPLARLGLLADGILAEGAGETMGTEGAGLLATLVLGSVAGLSVGLLLVGSLVLLLLDCSRASFCLDNASSALISDSDCWALVASD